MCLLSIVIPNYNNGRFLFRCLDSILCSKRMDFEVIVIDDGSSDNSIEVLKMVKDKRCYYYTQENQGVSAARNAGIKKAKGEFITFCDSDDYYENDAITEILLILEQNSFRNQLFIFDIVIEYTDTAKEKHRKKWQTAVARWKGIKKQKELPEDIYIEMVCRNSNMNSVYNKVFKTSILKEKKIVFPSGIGMGEDGIFNLNYACYCTGILYISKILYIYCTGENEMNSGNVKCQTSTLREIVSGLKLRNDILNIYSIQKNMIPLKRKKLKSLLDEYAVEQLYCWSRNIIKKSGREAYKKYLNQNEDIKKWIRSYFLKNKKLKRNIQTVLLYKETL